MFMLQKNTRCFQYINNSHEKQIHQKLSSEVFKFVSIPSFVSRIFNSAVKLFDSNKSADSDKFFYNVSGKIRKSFQDVLNCCFNNSVLSIKSISVNFFENVFKPKNF